MSINKLDSMTGVFSQPILDQIKGQSTAPLAGATSAAAPTSTGSHTSATGSSTGSATVTKSSAPAQTSNAAISTKAGWFGIVVGAIVGATMF
ncbi:hypothetical protein DXG03_003619 [Asterophora parasitica]|uniref:Uncharacterized protein n=1 Tax=Asterophora parasitica TaxID=117018 RepID=A0A9P7G3E6_9AGAR|nr:hypothetical protein DXG03_003619 [Asterophora parasitica]